MKDPYSILGISRDATPDEAKKAYRKLAFDLHPDRNQNNKDAEEKLKEVNAAYDEILNPSARQQRGGRNAHHTTQGFDFNDIFSSMGFDPFSGGFGGGMHQGHGVPASVVEAHVYLTLAEACLGTTKKITYDDVAPCTTCSGVGATKGNFSTCKQCNGSGQNTIRQGSFIISMGHCPVCLGKGKQITKSCSDCNGEGHKYIKQSIDVNLPPGVTTEHTLRVPIAKTGTLLQVYPQVEHKPGWTREGPNLHTTLNISLRDALLGITTQVETIHGSKTLIVPSCCASDAVLPIKGAGGKKQDRISYGDHFVHVHIEMPKSLTEEQRNKLLEVVSHDGRYKDTEKGVGSV